MAALRGRRLAEPVLDAAASGRPFLGICVGMQMLFADSEESPGVDGLGVIPGTVCWIPGDVKRPQMQWNIVSVVDDAVRSSPGSSRNRGSTSSTRCTAFRTTSPSSRQRASTGPRSTPGSAADRWPPCSSIRRNRPRGDCRCSATSFATSPAIGSVSHRYRDGAAVPLDRPPCGPGRPPAPGRLRPGDGIRTRSRRRRPGVRRRRRAVDPRRRSRRSAQRCGDESPSDRGDGALSLEGRPASRPEEACARWTPLPSWPTPESPAS